MQQFSLPSLAFQLQEKWYGIVLQLAFADLAASVGTLQLVFAAPVALAVTLAVFAIFFDVKVFLDRPNKNGSKYSAKVEGINNLPLAEFVNPVSPFPWQEFAHLMFPLHIHCKSCSLLAAAGY